jgi:hypothetical protein
MEQEANKQGKGGICLKAICEGGKLLPVANGWILCPFCDIKMIHINSETRAQNLELYCKKCKRIFLLDIK